MEGVGTGEGVVVVAALDGCGDFQGDGLPSIYWVFAIASSLRRDGKVFYDGQDVFPFAVGDLRFDPAEQGLFPSRIVADHRQHFAPESLNESDCIRGVLFFESFANRIDGAHAGESKFFVAEYTFGRH